MKGGVATFILNTTNVASGTSSSYSFSGVSTADITGGVISGTVNTGSVATFALSTTNVQAGTSVPYSISGSISPQDISGGVLTGSVVIDQNGQGLISIPTLTRSSYQGNKILTVTVAGQSASETLVDTNAFYTLISSSSSVNEGLNAVFTLNTTNVPVCTKIPYTITGSVASTDIAGGLLTGSDIVGANGVDTISIPTLTHLTFQGNKTLTVSASGASATRTLIDNAPAGSLDLYDGKYLSFSKVVSGTTTYSNIILSVQPSQIVSIGGGNPINNFDTYDGASQQLTVQNVKVGTSTYNNVVLKISPSDIVSVNGVLTKPPTVSVPDISLCSISPVSKTIDVKPLTNSKLTFSEYIKPVAGNITLIDPVGVKQLALDVTSNPLVQIAGNQLTVLHSDFYLASGTYQVLIPSGVIHGVSGGNYSGLNGNSINIIGLSTLNGNDGGGGGGGGGGGL